MNVQYKLRCNGRKKTARRTFTVASVSTKCARLPTTTTASPLGEISSMAFHSASRSSNRLVPSRVDHQHPLLPPVQHPVAQRATLAHVFLDDDDADFALRVLCVELEREGGGVVMRAVVDDELLV